jgi:filamentous hemagglutinin family protein
MSKNVMRGGVVMFAARAGAIGALCAFGLQPWVASAAGALPITVDSNAAARATLGTSSNGTQVVNIVAPNAAGLSNNLFTQYNVGTSGVVLNNAAQTVQSQIGGAVQANAALGGKNANTILLQVTSGAPSQLLGSTEVAGRSANVVLANPAGITCSGCGFINAPRVTLSTGAAMLGADGSLKGFDVTQGAITVDGAGLNASNSAIDLIARAMTINGKVQGATIDAIAGANRVDYATKTATAQAGAGSKPQVAIDVQSLGSMYGNGAVRLIGTEAGVGVRNNGAVSSVTGDITMSANGDVSIGAPASVNAGGNATINGANVTNAGALLAAGGLGVRADKALVNSGSVSAAGLTLTGQESLDSTGTVVAASAASLQGNRMTLSGGSVKAERIDLNGNAVTNRATVAAGRALNVHASSIDNQATLSSQGDVNLDAQQRIGNTGSLAADGSVRINTGAFDNSKGAVVASNGMVGVQADHVVNIDGGIKSGNAMSFDAQSIDNTNGTLASGMNLQMRLSGDLNNQGGSINAGNALSLDSQGRLLNANGAMTSGDAMTVSVQTLDNGSGRLRTEQGVMQLSGRTVQNAQGTIASGDMLRVSAETLTNDAGSIAAKRPASFDVQGRLSNVNGSITSDAMIEGSAGSLDNDGGTMTARDGVNLRTASSNAGPAPAPAPATGGDAPSFDPGPLHMRVAPEAFDPIKYQQGFFGPDGYFYAFIGNGNAAQALSTGSIAAR